MFDVAIIEKLNQYQTPFYYYDLDLLRESLAEVRKLASDYDFDIHYAVKANSNSRILQEICSYGLGADCVSGNEIKVALESGFEPDKILFAGVGKSDSEIKYALEKQIKAFNCESLQEIEVINQIAQSTEQVAEIAIRINPNVDAKTHKYITTGLDENKFGVNQSDLPEVIKLVKQSKNINLTGIHFHIGSQITDLNVFKGLCIRVNDIHQWMLEQGQVIKHINLGGGLGVEYSDPDNHSVPNFKDYFAIFDQFLERKENQQIHFELGRSIVAQCGSLISRVLYVKPGRATNFVILDAGMTELMRPALYQSFHEIENLTSKKQPLNYDVVGPICESSDCFGKAVSLPETQRGDLIAIRSAGAYGEVMTSRYNLREQNPAIYLP